MAYISDFIDNGDGTLTVPKIEYRPKKITGARFAAALGKDPFLTPFGLWCELTRVAQRPYKSTPSTRAGDALEDRIAAYVQSKTSYNVIQPHMIWGRGYKSENDYDFFKENKVFGGI